LTYYVSVTYVLLTSKVVTRPNLLLRSITVVTSVLWRGIDAGSNKLLHATSTRFGAFWDGFPWSKATVNSCKKKRAHKFYALKVTLCSVKRNSPPPFSNPLIVFNRRSRIMYGGKTEKTSVLRVGLARNDRNVDVPSVLQCSCSFCPTRPKNNDPRLWSWEYWMSVSGNQLIKVVHELMELTGSWCCPKFCYSIDGSILLDSISGREGYTS